MRLVTLLAVCVCIASCVAQTMPKFPTQYSAYISMNTDSASTFTFDYWEYQNNMFVNPDATVGVWRTEGRFVSGATVDQFTPSGTTEFTLGSTTDCRTYSGLPTRLRLMAAMSYFANLTDPNLGATVTPANPFQQTCRLTNPTTQLPLCNKWTATGITNGVTYSADVYWSVPDATGVGSAPVTFNLVRSDMTLNYEILRYVAAAPASSVFAVPATCTPAGLAQPPTLALPSANTLYPTAPSSTLPVLPNAYTLSFGGTLSNQRYSFTLRRSASPSVDRVDYNADASATGLGNTFLYRYADGPNGTTYNITNGVCNSVSMVAGAPKYDFLAARLSGVLGAFIGGSLPAPNAPVAGTNVRGAPTYAFSAAYSNVRSDYTYTGTYTISYYQQGWEFPNIANGLGATFYGVPARIYFTGTRRVTSDPNSEPSSFTESWDIYGYTPEQPQTSAFDIGLLGCMPPIPTQYTTVVSANLNDTGFSMQYTEAYDFNTGMLYTAGRMRDYFATETIATKSPVSMFVVDPVRGCTIYPNLTMGIPVYMGSTVDFFKTYRLPVSYTGQRTYRGMNTDVFTSTMAVNFTSPATQPGYQYVFVTGTYYWSIPGTSTDPKIPVAVVINGQRLNMTTGMMTPFSHSYDWAFFIPTAPSATLFAQPATCSTDQMNTVSPYPAVPTVSNVVPFDPVAFLELPMLTQFVATLEYTMSENDVPLPAVQILWYYDVVNQRERVEVRPNPSVGPTTGPSTVYINNWNTKLSGVLPPAGGCILVPNPVTSQVLPTRPWELSFMFNGNYNTQLGTAVITKDPVFIRGVRADNFRARVTTAMNNINYEFMADLNLFPNGWQWPGRGITTPPRVPAQFVFTGDFMNGTTKVSYKDTVEFITLQPGAAPPAYFDVLAAGCVVPPPSITDVIGAIITSNPGATAAVVIIILLLIGIGIGVGIWWYRRKTAGYNKKPAVNRGFCAA